MSTTTDGRPIAGAHGRQVYDDELGRPRCTANAKSSGDRCKRRPIPGGAVCRNHGGAAPQTAKSARRRLLELVDPAIAALADVLETEVSVAIDDDGRPHEYGPRYADRIRAAEAILDRTGHPRRQELDLGDARSRLLERLRAQTEDPDA